MIFAEKFKQLPYRFKTRFFDFQPEKILRNLRPKNLGPWNRLKFLEAVKHMKLLFLYFLKNSNNFLMNLKPDFMILSMETSFVIYEQKDILWKLTMLCNEVIDIFSIGDKFRNNNHMGLMVSFVSFCMAPKNFGVQN